MSESAFQVTLVGVYRRIMAEEAPPDVTEADLLLELAWTYERRAAKLRTERRAALGDAGRRQGCRHYY